MFKSTGKSPVLFPLNDVHVGDSWFYIRLESQNLLNIVLLADSDRLGQFKYLLFTPGICQNFPIADNRKYSSVE